MGSNRYECNLLPNHCLAAVIPHEGLEAQVVTALWTVMQNSPLEAMLTNKIKGADSLQEVEEIVLEWGSSFKGNQTTAAFNKAANKAGRNPTAVHKLVDQLVPISNRHSENTTVRNLASVLWSCGKLHCTDGSLWISTVELFVKKISTARPLDVANVA